MSDEAKFAALGIFGALFCVVGSLCLLVSISLGCGVAVSAARGEAAVAGVGFAFGVVLLVPAIVFLAAGLMLLRRRKALHRAADEER